MTVYRHCCPLLRLLLVALSTGLSFGILNITRTGCRGDSIKLFQNIKVDSDNTTLSLYKKNILTVMWYSLNSVQRPRFVNGYSEKFFLDKSGNIWILDLQDLDEANYVIIYQIGNTTKKDEIKLDVLVQPETSCKPKIIRGVDTLTTYLEPDGCGKPAASAYWLEQPGISVERNVIKLQPGQEAGKVYACIDGPALRCAKSSKFSDYCSVFIDENKVHSRLSDISGVTIATLVITILYDNLYILIIVILYQRLMHTLKKNAKSTNLSEWKLCKTDRMLSYLAGNELGDGDGMVEVIDEKFKQSTGSIPSLPRAAIPSQEETVSLLEEMETANSVLPQLSEKTIPHLEEKEAAYFTPPQRSEKTIPQSEKKDAADSTRPQLSEKTIFQLKEKDAADSTPPQLSDPEHEAEEATTDHQPSTNSKSMRELQELRDAALCKICFVNKMSTVFMPCNHIATCVSCSTSLKQCPVCRALIMEKMNISFGCI